MKPLIGIPLRYEYLKDGRPILYLNERIRRTLQLAGANVEALVPVQDINYMDIRAKDFPELTDEEKQTISDNLDKLDGIIFPGGYKFNPYDRYLLEVAIEKEIPILGICLGMQMLSCYKKDDFVLEEVENHKQKDDLGFCHKVIIDKDSTLYKILEKEEIMVNSFHTKKAPKNDYYKVIATSDDGIIEAIEYPSKTFNIGIQWHPEIDYRENPDSKRIIDYFINECKKQS